MKTETSIKFSLEIIMKDDRVTRSYLQNAFSNVDMELSNDLIDFMLIVVIKSRNSLTKIKVKELMKIFREYRDSKIDENDDNKGGEEESDGEERNRESSYEQSFSDDLENSG
jgi:hypothetical protein